MVKLCSSESEEQIIKKCSEKTKVKKNTINKQESSGLIVSVYVQQQNIVRPL